MAAFCSCCVSYHLRKRQLRGDMTRYIWCGLELQQRLSWERFCAASACSDKLAGDLKTCCKLLTAPMRPVPQLQWRLALLRPLWRAVLAPAVPVPGGGLGVGQLECICQLPRCCTPLRSSIANASPAVRCSCPRRPSSTPAQPHALNTPLCPAVPWSAGVVLLCAVGGLHPLGHPGRDAPAEHVRAGLSLGCRHCWLSPAACLGS